METEIKNLEEELLKSYPTSIQRKMAEVKAEKLKEDNYHSLNENEVVCIAIKTMMKYSPDEDFSKHAIAHYMIISDNFNATEENAAYLSVALLRTAHKLGEYESPSKISEEKIIKEINHEVQNLAKSEDKFISFKKPSKDDHEKANLIVEQAIMREKGRTPSSWADQIMSAAVAITAAARGEELNSKTYRDLSKMAVARYFSEGNTAPKKEYLHGISARISSDVRHMSDMNDLLANIELSQKGGPVNKKWAEAVKFLGNRRDVIENIQHDASGHYHLLPKSDQISIQWDLEYSNNLLPENKKRIEAQVKRIIKVWKLDIDQPKDVPYILRQAQNLKMKQVDSASL